MNRVDNVRLVRLDDPLYRAQSTRFRNARWARTPQAPARERSSRDLFAKDAERTLRWFVNDYRRIVPERVIAYTEHVGRYRNERYRELDLVAREGDDILIGEIKTTESACTIKHGVEQLRIASDLLAPLAKTVTSILLIVDMDDAPNSVVATSLSHRPGLRLVGALDELVPGAMHVMPLVVADIVALAKTELHLDWRTAA